jgi:hypothetical protein
MNNITYKDKFKKYNDKFKHFIGGNFTLNTINEYIDNNMKEKIKDFDLIIGIGTCTEYDELSQFHEYIKNTKMSVRFVAIFFDPAYMGTSCNIAYFRGKFAESPQFINNPKISLYTDDKNCFFFIVGEGIPMNDKNYLLWNYARNKLISNSMGDYFRSFNNIPSIENDQESRFLINLEEIAMKFEKIFVFNQAFFNERFVCYRPPTETPQTIRTSQSYKFCFEKELEFCSHERNEFEKYDFGDLHDIIKMHRRNESMETYNANVFFERMPAFIKILNNLKNKKQIFLIYSADLLHSEQILNSLQNTQQNQTQNFYIFKYPDFNILEN